MKRTVDFAGFFWPSEDLDVELVCRGAAEWASLDRAAKPVHNEILYRGPDGRPAISALIRPDEWSEFGVFGLTREFVEQYGSDEVMAWLIGISRQIRARLGRSFVSLTVPRLEEIVSGPDCLHWLQYFGAEIGVKWDRALIKRGPFYASTVFDDGAVAIALGETPFDHLHSAKAAATFLRIQLRPLVAKDMKGRDVELDWQ